MLKPEALAAVREMILQPKIPTHSRSGRHPRHLRRGRRVQKQVGAISTVVGVGCPTPRCSPFTTARCCRCPLTGRRVRPVDREAWAASRQCYVAWVVDAVRGLPILGRACGPKRPAANEPGRLGRRRVA